ncbi:uncharacterized protein LOC108026880 [Drosophila biarmipes]|uniref:uncharacterized protein LOC108026880 n=1 Tax=Drosophila biarmipes TaxID=125945 RepID=UPI0007E72616|nr:uncharacterized protein LOC108026880 [Drosophila biarmipes]
MPGQYINRKYTRSIMVILRFLWAFSYLWAMMHAAAILPIPYERWENNFWSKKRNYVLTYKSLFEFKMKTEMYVHVLVFVVLFSLYRCCQCRLIGARFMLPGLDRPSNKYRLMALAAPYWFAFIGTWTISTLITVWGLILVVKRDESDRTYVLIAQLIIAMLFKLMVLANVYSTVLRIWGYIKIFEKDSIVGQLNYNNFGDHLDLFFRV